MLDSGSEFGLGLGIGQKRSRPRQGSLDSAAEDGVIDVGRVGDRGEKHEDEDKEDEDRGVPPLRKAARWEAGTQMKMKSNTEEAEAEAEAGAGSSNSVPLTAASASSPSDGADHGNCTTRAATQVPGSTTGAAPCAVPGAEALASSSHSTAMDPGAGTAGTVTGSSMAGLAELDGDGEGHSCGNTGVGRDGGASSIGIGNGIGRRIDDGTSNGGEQGQGQRHVPQMPRPGSLEPSPLPVVSGPVTSGGQDHGYRAVSAGANLSHGYAGTSSAATTTYGLASQQQQQQMQRSNAIGGAWPVPGSGSGTSASHSPN